MAVMLKAACGSNDVVTVVKSRQKQGDLFFSLQRRFG